MLTWSFDNSYECNESNPFHAATDGTLRHRSLSASIESPPVLVLPSRPVLARFHDGRAIVGLLFVTSVAILGGCSTWTKNASWSKPAPTSDESASADTLKGRSVRQVRHQPGSVVLQADFVTFSWPENPDAWASIWQWADETPIDPDVRHRWAENGLRVGWVKDNERLHRRLASLSPESTVVDEFMKQAEVSGDASGLDQSIPMRLGTRYELTVCPALAGEHTILASLGGSLVGQTMAAPQPVFSMFAEPGDLDQTIRLAIQPEIQHGNMRQSFTPSRAGVRLDHRRDSWVLNELQLVAQLSEGDTILVTPTSAPMGLGQTMLTQENLQRQPTCTAMKLTVQSIPRQTGAQ